jgi:ketosteroid isomerase-like protein
MVVPSASTNEEADRMTAARPEELHRLIATAVSDGDIDAYLALYEPGAALAKRGGGVAVGSTEIRDEIAPFLALRGTLSVATTNVVESGDIALLHSRGSFTGVAPDGSRVEVPEHDAAEVARRQPDGDWLFLVNNPWGSGA